MIVVALHGFFGSPDDWRDPFKAHEDSEIDLVTPDLAVWATRSGITDFETFAATLNRSVRMLSEERNEPVIIAGYSMGARLAAYCLLDEPDLYQSALFISMNPGIKAGDFQARRDRVALDSTWSEKMRRDAWEITWKSWNEQPVLKAGSLYPKPAEMKLVAADSDFAERLAESEAKERKLAGRREAWARAMDIWTLGLQTDLRRDLLEWAKEEEGRRMTLMTGADDTKFTEITAEWLAGAVVDSVQHVQVQGAGHRILLETPQTVVSEVLKLI